MVAKDVYDGLGPRDLRPLPNTDLDLTAVRMTPIEGFVLSRVDGLTSYREITMVTGLPPDETLKILRELKLIGLIFNPGDTPLSAPRARVTSAATARPKPQSPAPPLPSVLARLDDGSAVDAALLAEGPELDRETKTRIARVHRRLGRLDAPTLLGVARDADPRELKRAYFAASKELHPDRHFGKNIGRYRTMLEELFKRCTAAFNELNEPHRKKK